MSLQTQLAQDLTTAMKARDKVRMGALRMVISNAKNKAVELGRGPQGELSDDEVLKLLAVEVKRRKDASSQYRDAGRPELADTEDAEAEIFSAYLPSQLDDDALTAVVEAVIAETGATSMKDMGGVIKQVMAQVAGQAEGARVSALVKGRLG